MAKLTLRPDQVEALQAWLDAARPIMGLSHWYMVASADPPGAGGVDDYAYAATFFEDNSDRVTIHLGDAYWKETLDDRRVTLTHEMLHCVMRAYRRFSLTRLRKRDRAFASELHEISVDHLARVMASLLPMPEIPE